MTDDNNNDQQKTRTSLSDHGVFMLTGEVNTSNVNDAIKFILKNNLNPECDLEYMTMIINSEGGYTSDGFALIDVMLGSHIPIYTVGIGLIASMGLLLFLTGEKGHRTLTPNTMILSHQFSGFSIGKEHELVAAQVGHDLLAENILRHYQRTTGLDKKTILENLLPPQDLWLSPNEAKKLGVCDAVKDLKPRHFVEVEKTKTKPRKKK
jgi:ATP-dependent Clp protease protease subunit